MFLLVSNKGTVDLLRPVRISRLETRLGYIPLEDARQKVNRENQLEGEGLDRDRKLDLCNSGDHDNGVYDPKHRRYSASSSPYVDWLIGEGSNHVACRRAPRRNYHKLGSRLTPCSGPKRGGRRRRDRPVRPIGKAEPQSEPTHAAERNSRRDAYCHSTTGLSTRISAKGLSQEPLGRIERSHSVRADNRDFSASTIHAHCAPVNDSEEPPKQASFLEGAIRVPLSERMYEKYFAHGISVTTGEGTLAVWTYESHHDERGNDMCVDSSDDFSNVGDDADKFASDSQRNRNGGGSKH
jgi:hypothetical protein